jgi:hypothetical protein
MRISTNEISSGQKSWKSAKKKKKCENCERADKTQTVCNDMYVMVFFLLFFFNSVMVTAAG